MTDSVLKERSGQPSKAVLPKRRRDKDFPTKPELRKLITSEPVLQEMLKGLPQAKIKC